MKQIDPYIILQELSFERLAGSNNEKRGAEVIISNLKQLGLKVKRESFGLNSFDTGKGKLTIDDKQFEVVPFGLNKDCRVEGEFLFLENPEILKQNKGRYRGKIVAAYGFSRQLLESIQDQELAAYISISRPERKASSSSHRQKTFKDGYTNSATMSYEDGIKAARLSGRIGVLKITQDVSEKKATNLIVDIEGTDPDDNLTYLVAHYDSVARSPGASDNGGGTVSLIKIAEYFINNRPKRNLRLIFFSGEELGLLGSQHYVASHEEEVIKKGSLVLNIDVSGDPLGINRVIVTGSKELLGYSEGILLEENHCFNHALDIYSSDQMPFVRLELPGISIARVAGKGSFHIHTPDDSIDRVSADGLKRPIEAAITLLRRILNAEIYPVRRQIDPSLREKIERYFWNLTYEEPSLKWTPKYKE